MREKVVETEYLVDNGKTYIKSEGKERELYGFFLRFIGKHFSLCKKCQKELEKIINEAEQSILGNKDYEPPVELYRKFELDDASWKIVEKRPASIEEQKRLACYD